MKKIWDSLCSVKLTIFLLVLLAGTSIIGTIIPQGEAGGQFIKNLGPVFQKIVVSFQLQDMYHSLWFQLIIFILTLNLIACSINKLPGTFRLYKKIPSPDREKIYSDASADRKIKSRRTASETFTLVKDVIRRHYSRTVGKKDDSSIYLYADRGRYSLFGVYLVHFSVILILAGAIIGSLYGFKGYVNIAEGESVDSVSIFGSSGHNHKDLGFTVSCDKSTVEYYDDGRPKEYKSDIRISVDGKTVKEASLLVNHPLTFRGITFYLSNMGVVPGDEALITVNTKDGKKPATLHATLGKPTPLPDNGGEIILEDTSEDFMRMMGPAVLIRVKPSVGEEAQIWLFKYYKEVQERFSSILKRSPKFNPAAVEPFTFTLDDVELVPLTGLQVNKDPGIFFIYSGFFAIVIGLFITFFTSHRRVWVKIQEDGKGARITVAGRANKNPVGMENDLDRLTNQIKTKLDRK